MDSGKIQLAGRFRRVFIRAFTNRGRGEIHSEPRGSPGEEDVQRGISGDAQKIQCRTWILQRKENSNEKKPLKLRSLSKLL